MACNLLKKNKKLKRIYLEHRLKRLRKKFDDEVETIILMYPKEAARMDAIENSFPSCVFKKIKIEISATEKLLSNISKN